MADKNFRYVIQTELNLTPGALNKLLGQIRELNQKIEQQKTFVHVNARLAPNARESIQREIGQIKATAKIHLRVDHTSIQNAQREIDRIARQLGQNAGLNPAAANPNNVPNTQGRVGSRNQPAAPAPRRPSADADPQVVASRIKSEEARQKYWLALAEKVRVATENSKQNQAEKAARVGEPRSIAQSIKVTRNLKSLDSRGETNLFPKLQSVGKQSHDIDSMVGKLKELEQTLKRLQTNKALGANFFGDPTSSVSRQIPVGKQIDSVINRINNLRTKIEQAKLELSSANKEYQNALRMGASSPAYSVSADVRQLELAKKANAEAERRRREEREAERLANRPFVPGTATTLKPNHPTRVLIGQIRQQRLDQEAQAALEGRFKLGSSSSLPKYHPLSIINRVADQVRGQQESMAQVKIGRASALPKNHPLAMLNAQIAQNLAQEVARASMKLGSASNLPQNHPASLMQRVGATARQPEMVRLERSLVDPSITTEQRQANYNDLVDQYKKLAVRTNQNIPKTFTIYDELAGKVRTSTKEFTAQGKMVDRADKSLQHMAETMGKNIMFYSAISMGFYQITNGIAASVRAMAEFESQFLKIQTITDKKGAEVAKKDVFSIAQKYGLDPTSDVLPIYTSLLRQKDIVKPDQVKMLSQLIVRAGRVDEGGNVNSQDFAKISTDFMSVYRQANPTWQSQGKNSVRQMNDFVDFVARMTKGGVSLDTNLDAMSNLMPLFSSKGIDMKMLSSMVGATQIQMGDATGSELSTNIKLFVENLMKPNAPGSRNARQIIGVQANDSADTVLRTLADKVSSKQLSEEQKGAIAGYLATANGGGGGGGFRSNPFKQIIDALPTSVNLYEEALKGTTTAEEIAQRNAHTLIGEWGKLKASAQQLAVSFGESGLSDALKSVIRVMTEFLNIVNSALSLLGKLGGLTQKIFGEDVGKSINSAVAQLLVFTAAVKAAGFAYKQAFGPEAKFGGFFGGGGKKGVGQTVADTALSVATSGIMVPKNVVRAPMNPTTQTASWTVSRAAVNNAKNITSVAAPASKVGGVGATIGNVALGVLGLRGLSGGGIGNTMARFGEILTTRILPALVRFAMLLGRLSVWGAVIGGAFMIGNQIHKANERSKDAKAVAALDMFSPENKTQTVSDLGTVREAINAGMPKGLTEKQQQKYREMRQHFQLDFGTYDEGTPEKEQQKAYFAAMQRLTSSYKDNKGGLMARAGGNFDLYYKNEIGERQKGQFNVSDNKQVNDVLQLMNAIQNNTGTLSQDWKDVNKNALDYVNILTQIQEVSLAMENATAYMNTGIGISNIKFLGGGENSASSYLSQLNVVQKSSDAMSSQYGTILDQKNKMESDQNATATRLLNAQTVVKNLDNADSIFKELNDAFASAKQSGNLEGLVNQYDVTNLNPTDEQAAKYNYIKAMADKSLESTNLEQAKKDIEQLTQQITSQIQSLKQLAIAYTVASSGVNVFDGALKQAGASVAEAQHNLNLALTVPDKISATKSVFGETAKEARLYKEQLSGLERKIAEIKQSSSDDFSMNALYNPGANGLTINQASVKQMTEQSFEIKANYNQAVEALHSQVDAIADLVFSTEKYSYIWDSVNKRIELSKQLAGELRDIQTSKSVDQKVGNFRASLEGANFDTGGFSRENAQRRRDSALDIFSRTQYAMATYKDDQTKLGEALSEITGGTKSVGEQLKDAFLSPLSDLVKTDFQSAGATQLAAANTMQKSISTLESILASYQTKLNELLNVSEPVRTGSVGTTTTTPRGSKGTLMGDPHDPSDGYAKKTTGLGKLGGLLAGHDSEFIAAGQKYGIDPMLLAAISMHETGNGTSAKIKKQNNVAGMTDTKNGGFKNYASINDSIDDMARVLATNYLGRGRNSISSIGMHYAPPNASNDPTGLNRNWESGVAKFYEQLSGTTTTSAKKFYLNGQSLNSGGYYGPSTPQGSGNKIDTLLSEALNLKDTKKFTYKQVPGEFKGSYDQFIKSAISDCSQFVQEMYKQFLGVKLPRTAAEQWKAGQGVDRKDIQKGDLVFFNTTGKAHSHVGVSKGGNEFVHMGSRGLQTGDLTSASWSSKFEGARRISGIEPSASAKIAEGAQANKSNAAQAIQAQIEAILAQVDFLNPKYVDQQMRSTRSKAASNADVESMISGMSIDSILGKVDARKEALRSVSQAKSDAESTLGGYQKAVNDKGTPKELLPVYKKMILTLQENIKSLDNMTKTLKGDLYKDPKYNGVVAADEIAKAISQLDKLRSQGKEGGIEWYQQVDNVNRMYSEFATRKKATSSQQELFDNSGYGYDRLILSKMIGFNEDVALTVRKLGEVRKALGNMREGTNAWHIAMEDAVAAQEHLIELENKKTEVAKRNFELTGTGLHAYINDRGYQQGRDIVRSNSNLNIAKDRYRNNPSSNYTENLVNLQVVGDMYQKVQGQIQEYRSAIVDSFRAGVLSITEYILKLNELRDVQTETRDQALSMTESLQSTFQTGLADALKSGFEGSFSAPEDFVKNIKSGIAGTLSNQMSTIMLTQSGLMDGVNSMIAQMVTQMTKGPSSANAFNVADFEKMMNDAINPMLPYITAIADSTKGMFSLMKDEVFNAPGGFKVDSYLYGFQKSMSYEDYTKKYGSGGATGGTTPTNEAGSPMPVPGAGGPIVLPPTTTPIGSGIGQIINNPPVPIESITAGINNQTTRNPVRELLNDVVKMQNLYDDKTPLKNNYNSTLHGTANQARELLGQIAPDILKKLGDGVSKGSMNDKQIIEYLRSTDLSSYDMVTGIDGVNSGIGGMASSIAAKLDMVNSSVNGVASVLGGQGRPSSGGGGGSSGGSSGGGTIITPPVPIGGGNSGGVPVINVPGGVTGPVTIPSNSVLDRMKQNGDAWSDASPSQKKALADANKKLGESQGWHRVESTGIWYDSSGKRLYHNGGIAGVMNFAQSGSLKPNEVEAVLRKGEPVFSTGQLGSFVNGVLGNGGAGSNGTNLNITVTIQGNSSGVSDESITEAIRDGVAQGMYQMSRQNRLGNLQTRGVSYGN